MQKLTDEKYEKLIERISIKAESIPLAEVLKTELAGLLNISDEINIEKNIESILNQSYIPFATQEPAPRKFYQDDFIPQGQVVLLGGMGGEGKSRLSLQLLLHCLLNNHLSDDVLVRNKINKALVFSAEDDRVEIHKRLYQLKSFFEQRGIPKSETLKAEKNIITITDETKGIGTLLTIQNFGKIIPTENYTILKTIIEKEQPQIIVLDALTSVFSADWNSMGDIQEVMRLCKHLITGTSSSIILIHHMTKNAYNPENFDDLLGSIFGSVGTINRLRHVLLFYKHHLLIGKSNINGRIGIQLHDTLDLSGYVSTGRILRPPDFENLIDPPKKGKGKKKIEEEVEDAEDVTEAETEAETAAELITPPTQSPTQKKHGRPFATAKKGKTHDISRYL